MISDETKKAIADAVLNAAVSGLVQWAIDELKEAVKQPKPAEVEEPAKPWIKFS